MPTLLDGTVISVAFDNPEVVFPTDDADVANRKLNKQLYMVAKFVLYIVMAAF